MFLMINLVLNLGFILRNFIGSDAPNYFEVSQHVSHLNALHYIEEHKAYCRYDDNGDLTKPIRIKIFDIYYDFD